MKKCKSCGIEKPIIDFYMVRRGTVVDSRCKPCRSIEAKIKNKKKAEFEGRTYREKGVYNKDSESKICTCCNVDKPVLEFNLGGNGKDGYQPKCKSCRKAYRVKNRQKLSDQQLSWQARNREKKSKYQLDWYYLRRNEESFKISLAIRSILARTVKQIGHVKKQRACDELGYASIDLKNHMESLFTDGMCWGNHGEWHIDHIKPVSLFVKEGETDPSVINALDNLQPLWASDNLSKGAKYARS